MRSRARSYRLSGTLRPLRNCSHARKANSRSRSLRHCRRESRDRAHLASGHGNSLKRRRGRKFVSCVDQHRGLRTKRAFVAIRKRCLGSNPDDEAAARRIAAKVFPAVETQRSGDNHAFAESDYVFDECSEGSLASARSENRSTPPISKSDLVARPPHLAAFNTGGDRVDLCRGG